jgi:hypothetical protein
MDPLKTSFIIDNMLTAIAEEQGFEGIQDAKVMLTEEYFKKNADAVKLFEGLITDLD